MIYTLKKYETEYHLFSNKRAEFAQYSIADGKLEQIGKMSDALFPWIEGRPRVIASTQQKQGLPTIDMAALKILLGEADIKEIAAKWVLKNTTATTELSVQQALNKGFFAGYNKCLEVNADKRFTVDDMGRLIRWLSMSGKFLHSPTGNLAGNRPIVEEFVRTQGYTQKTEWNVQIEMDHTPQALPEDRYVPKITNGQINIIKIVN